MKVSQTLGLATAVLGRIVRPKISRVTIPVTYDCNQKCKTCGIWDLNKGEDSRKREELTLEEFSQFCRTNDILWIALTGGESFLRKDMDEVLSIAMSHSNFVSVVTNGFSANKIVRDVEGALALPVSKATITVSVSFNGPELVHDEIAGVKGSYRRARETYKELEELKHPRLRVNISYTSSNFNLGKFEGFTKEFGKPIGIADLTYLVAQDSPSYFRTDWEKVIPPTLRETQELIKGLLPTYKVSSVFDFIGKKYLEGWLNGHRVGCVAGTYNLMFDPYWNAYPCMFYCPTEPIGNLREVGWDIRNLDFKKCRELVDNCKSPCWTPCETFSTMLFRPWRCL